MAVRSRILRFVILGSVAMAAACEDMPAGPGGLEALAAEGTAGAGGVSLRDLFAAAVFRVQRDEGADSALAVLGRWRDARDADGATDLAREIEAGTVVRAFGEDVVAQAAAVLAGELREADLAVTRVLAEGRELDIEAIQRELDAAAASIERARSAAAQSPDGALLVLDDAADRLSGVRMRLVEATGLPTLDALYAKALERAGERASAARAEEDRLLADVDSARAEGGIDGRYEAQTALREHRARFAVEILGDEVGGGILDGVTEELERLRPALDSLGRAGYDIGRDRRMAEAAAAIAERADAALRAGEAARALDLAAHAAGLVEELRRQRVR